MSEMGATSPSELDVAATTPVDHSPQTPSNSVLAVAAPIYDDMDDQTLLQPGTHRALFSTDLGKRAKNSISTPAPPVIVRSNKVVSVLESVDFWRRKYPHFAWSIFPESGWTVEDLWDAADIHVETREHCQAVLDFLSRDNAVSVGLFTKHWSLQNTDKFLNFMAMRDTLGVSDPKDPLGLVDALFVNGEFNNWPRHFLWHTMQALRTSKVHYYQAEQDPAMTAESTRTSIPANSQPAVTEKQPIATVPVDDAPSASGSSTQPGLPMDKAPQSSAVRSTAAPFVPSVASTHDLQQPSNKRAPSHGPTHSGPLNHSRPVGHIMNGMSTHPAGPQAMSGPTLFNPKSRSGPQDAYMQSSLGTYGENLPRMSSGGYPSRPPPGPMPVHSPHFNPAAMAMGPAIISPHQMQVYPQGFPPMSPSAYAAQPYLPVLGHPMVMPPQHMHAPSMSIPSGYDHQGPSHRGPRGTSMGDVTNNPYYTNHSAPQNPDPRRPDRRGSFYGSSNSPLYDPYNGTRSTFNEHSSSRKPSRGGFTDQSGRSRKFSGPDNRFRHGSYGLERIDVATGNNHHPRGAMLDDPKIVGDALRGCHQGWIGPDNHSVNELFVSELPDGTQPTEIQDLFIHDVGITPVRAIIKQTYGGRSHAFVLFASTGDAKLALGVAEGSPKIKDVPVRVSVPRRFYQYPREEEYYNNGKTQNVDSQPTETRTTRGVTRMSSHEEENVAVITEAEKSKLQYSPQDARSDLLRKAIRPLPETDLASIGSPEAQNTKMRQSPQDAIKVSQSKQPFEEKRTKEESVGQVGQQSEPNATVSNTTDAEKPMESLQSNDGGSVEISKDLSVVQTPENDAIATTEKSLSGTSKQLVQELGHTKGHVRVESQTKATFEYNEDASSTSDGATVVVKVPSPAKKDGVRAQETSTMVENGEIPTVDVGSAPAPETGSDEDVGNDSSFMSAQEVVDSGDATALLKLDPTGTNTGTELDHAIVAQSPMKEESTRSSSTSQPELPQQSSLPADQDTASPVAAVIDSSAHTSSMSNAAKDIEAEEVKTPAQAPTISVKKQGPQQTPSLNPFAKPNKSQRKKERELKKRELKKEQDEKTVKVKANTVISVSTPNAQSNGASPSNMDAQAPTPLLAADDSTTDVKENGKATAQTSAAEASKKTTSGKQTGFNTANITREIGSVTQKAKVVQKTMRAPEMESSDHFAPLSYAQPPRLDDKPVSEQTVAQALDTVAAGSLVKADAAPTATKIKKAVAIPNLNLQPSPSSNRLQAIQSGSTTSSRVESPITGNPVGQQYMSKFIPEFDAMSAASSATLLASEGGQPSPSPTTQAFHTPLQTPALPDATQEQADKTKKKKKKSKKKKTPAAAVEAADHGSSVVGSPVVGADTKVRSPNQELEDPFGHQMSHIDAVRAAVKNPNTYYNRVNREIAERDAAKETGEDVEESKDMTGIDLKTATLREIQAFLMDDPELLKKTEGDAMK